MTSSVGRTSFSAPGVYVDEVPRGPRPIEPLPTSVTAFVGRARRGPVDRAVAVGSMAAFEAVFGALTTDSGLGYGVRAFFTNGGRSAVVVRVHDGGATAQVDLGGGLVVEAVGPGSWANGLVVGVSHPSPDEASAAASVQGLATGDDLFTIWLTLDGHTELFPHVTLVDGPRRLDAVLEASTLARVRSPLTTTRPDPGSYPVSTPGADGQLPTVDAYVSSAGERRGITALDDVDLVNLLVLPPSSPDSALPDGVWVAALAYAQQRRAFLIVDPPPGMPGSDVPDWLVGVGLTGAAARNAAIYYPRVDQRDPLSGGAVRSFAPSGAVAGVYARLDAARGVWKAPAGIEAALTDVVGPSVVWTQIENGDLNQVGVNVIRAIDRAGTVVWGARTLRGADAHGDEYRYVPVRRLALHLEESVIRSLDWAVFEPNGEPLWARIRQVVGDFMQQMFRQGAFAGATPREAYVVKCDAETTTAADIADGFVEVLVGFAPLKPAEFIIFKVRTRAAPLA